MAEKTSKFKNVTIRSIIFWEIKAFILLWSFKPSIKSDLNFFSKKPIGKLKILLKYMFFKSILIFKLILVDNISERLVAIKLPTTKRNWDNKISQTKLIFLLRMPLSILSFKSNGTPQFVISDTKVKKRIKNNFDFFCDKIFNILFLTKVFFFEIFSSNVLVK